MANEIQELNQDAVAFATQTASATAVLSQHKVIDHPFFSEQWDGPVGFGLPIFVGGASAAVNAASHGQSATNVMKQTLSGAANGAVDLNGLGTAINSKQRRTDRVLGALSFGTSSTATTFGLWSLIPGAAPFTGTVALAAGVLNNAVGVAQDGLHAAGLADNPGTITIAYGNMRNFTNERSKAGHYMTENVDADNLIAFDKALRAGDLPKARKAHDMYLEGQLKAYNAALHSGNAQMAHIAHDVYVQRLWDDYPGASLLVRSEKDSRQLANSFGALNDQADKLYQNAQQHGFAPEDPQQQVMATLIKGSGRPNITSLKCPATLDTKELASSKKTVTVPSTNFTEKPGM